jgi:hypothetical protein
MFLDVALMREYRMNNKTLLLPGFHPSTLCRKPRSAREKLAEQLQQIRAKSISQLQAYFQSIIPASALQTTSSGTFSRQRLFSKANTFWGFFLQTLNADSGCQEVVRQFQALAASKGLPIPSSSTAAYCQARQRFPHASLEQILSQTSEALHRRARLSGFQQRRVVVVDGSGLSMPDTPANQERWPQQSQQTPGCGFPQARLCACFCLHSGALLSHRIGNRKQQELPLLRDQWETLKPNDILLGDKAYCSYFDIANLQARDVDTVVTLGIRKPTAESEAIAVLGNGDLLVRWKRPKHVETLSYDEEAWSALPEAILMRQIRVRVSHPGFRSSEFYIVTTLTDHQQYPSEAIADLYLQRWDVELFLRDLKTSMDMDILRCKTPEMIEKEIMMHLIVYNCVRLLINQAADRHAIKPRSISFKAALQALRQWLPWLDDVRLKLAEQRRLMNRLLEAIANKTILERPGRREPRCVKRRPKPFALLTAPRHMMVEIPHRGRYRARKA